MDPKFGQSGIVVRTNDSAFKGPFHETVNDIKFESSVYERMGYHPRVAEYRGFRNQRIELKFYENGDVNSKISDPEFKIPLINWANQILEVLAFIHDKGVVHGDIRCPNILMTDKFDLVLADFGSAAIDGVKGTSTLYDTWHCIPGFDDLDHKITPQDDLFAFGTVLYHLSTRNLPFQDHNEEEITRL